MHRAVAASCVLAIAAAHHQPCHAQFSSGVVALIPADAHAVVIAPNLKRASDNLTRLLEGMDRANLLLGSRPIDLLRSTTGLAVGLDDQRDAAFVVLDSQPDALRFAWIVPVTDAATFLDVNFTAAEGDDPTARRTTGGRTVHTQQAGSYVVISDDRQTIADWPHAQRINAAALDDPAAWVNRAERDVLVLLRPPALQSMLNAAMVQLGPWAAPLAGDVRLSIGHIEHLALAVSCDPLALIVRSELRWKADSPLASLIPADAGPQHDLDRLPARSFALAVMIDFAALGGARAATTIWSIIAPNASVPPLDWLDRAHGVAVAIAPAPASGMLNETALVFVSSHPAEIREGWLGAMTVAGREVVLTSDTAGAGERFTLAPPLAADEHPVNAVLEPLLFGPSGPRGSIRLTDDALLLTFSPRQAALNDLAHSKDRLGATPAARIMRQWMPTQRDVEGYVHAADVAAMLVNAARGLAIAPPTLPVFDAQSPPIGFACDAAAGGVSGTIILPAAVLTPLFDDALRRIRETRSPADDRP